jgi:hypothetical protein
MKVFHIINNRCNAQFKQYNALTDIPEGTLSAKMISEMVEAPDYVFTSWGYIPETKKFIKPTTPEGFAYDEGTGTFYPIGESLLAHIQRNNNLEVYSAVVQGKIDRETYKIIIGQDFIDLVE